mgnify:CR=1 FL=1
MLLLGLTQANPVQAQEGLTSSSSHTVSLGVSPITVMSISGDPIPFMIERQSDDQGGAISESSTFYNVTTNVKNVYLTAELDFPMPEGTELWIAGESVLGNSHGLTRMNSNGRKVRLATGLKRGLENGRALEYRFTYDDTVTDIPFQSRSILFSLVHGPSKQSYQITRTVYFGVSTSDQDAGSSSGSKR